jgi:adenylate kinase family enzyme
MRRVAVIGCSGAGKSRFARLLAEETGLPLVHLDAEFWQPGWKASDRSDWLGRHAELVAGDNWILDGNYGGCLEQRLMRADTVFWFDLPTIICMASVMKRMIAGYGHTRPDMAPECPERFDREFLRYVMGFRRIHRPRILEALTRHGAHLTVHRFATRADVATYLGEGGGVHRNGVHAQI